MGLGQVLDLGLDLLHIVYFEDVRAQTHHVRAPRHRNEVQHVRLSERITFQTHHLERSSAGRLLAGTSGRTHVGPIRKSYWLCSVPWPLSNVINLSCLTRPAHPGASGPQNRTCRWPLVLVSQREEVGLLTLLRPGSGILFPSHFALWVCRCSCASF